MTALRFKKHVEAVARMRNDKRDRHERFRLDANERLSPLPEALWERFKRDLRQEDVLCYPETEKFYEKLATHLGLSVDNLVLTTGVDGAIKNCFEIFVRPGDAVVYPDPTFGMVDVYAKLFQAVSRKVSFQRRRVEMTDLLDALDEKVTFVFLPNPNSPSGHYFDNADVERLIRACSEKGIGLLLDEAYFGFSPGTAIGFVLKYENVAVARSFSKVYGLAGLRIGYLAADTKLASLLYKFRPMYEVNQPALRLASLVLDGEKEVFAYGEQTKEGRVFFVEAMQKRGFTAVSTDANFVYVDFGGKKEAVVSHLQRQGVLIRGSYNLEAFGDAVRFTVGPVETMKKLVSLMEEER